jgi:hypothetical protein
MADFTDHQHQWETQFRELLNSMRKFRDRNGELIEQNHRPLEAAFRQILDEIKRHYDSQ